MEQENKVESPDSQQAQVTRDLSNVGYPVAPFKFVMMSILTFNLYPMYWAYKNFVVLDTTPVKRPKILAVCSAIFLTFTFFWLMKYIEQASERHGHPIKMPKEFLAVSFVVMHVVRAAIAKSNISGMLEEILLWGTTAIFLLIMMVPLRAVLKLAETSEPPTPIDFDFTITNYVIMVIGGIMTLLGIAASFFG
jgi:hypothetical protein